MIDYLIFLNGRKRTEPEFSSLAIVSDYTTNMLDNNVILTFDDETFTNDLYELFREYEEWELVKGDYTFWFEGQITSLDFDGSSITKIAFKTGAQN